MLDVDFLKGKILSSWLRNLTTGPVVETFCSPPKICAHSLVLEISLHITDSLSIHRLYFIPSSIYYGHVVSSHHRRQDTLMNIISRR